MDGIVLELDGVLRRFGRVVALAGIDLAVRPGEVVGLLGHNGAGKTTVVRTLAGLLALALAVVLLAIGAGSLARPRLGAKLR